MNEKLDYSGRLLTIRAKVIKPESQIHLLYFKIKKVNTKITIQTTKEINAQLLFLTKLAKANESVAIIIGINDMGFILH